jgi:hypothetical protein
VFASGGSQQLIQTWGARGAFNHNWDPYWSSSVYAAWASVHYGSNATALICNTPGVGLFSQLAVNGGGITTCNPNYDVVQAGFITRWTPVKNLTFSADFTWSHLDQNYAGTIISDSLTSGKPLAAYAFSDQNQYLLMLRAQRNF